MVTENDYGVPVYYIDGEELLSFIESNKDCIMGYGYEWETENVTHLYFHPATHAFGRVHKVCFRKNGCGDLEDSTIHVTINADGSVCANGYPVNIIPARQDLHKRNKGLIELGILASKRVLIIGLGSGGSSIALDLAKAGVGSFALADFDRVELHNLSRHISSIKDLGRLKTDAVADAILGKNPYASVEKLPIDITKNADILEYEISASDVVMVCTDNNLSRFKISELLVKYKKVGIFGRAITRAEGGDVFIYRPGGPCYICLLGNDWYDQTAEEITNEASARRSGQIAAYMSAEDAEAIVQVGLASDIEPINNMMVKQALVELSKGSDSGITSLEDEFSANYYIWANRRDRQYANWGALMNTDGMPTIMRWYGLNISKNLSCPVCGDIDTLTVSDSYMESLKTLGSDEIPSLSSIDLDMADNSSL